MKKVITSICITALGSVIGLGDSASASSPIHGEGTYAVTGADVHSAQQVGTNTVLRQTLSIANEGVLSGPSTADVVCLIRAAGDGACAGVENFTGTIDGRTGTARFAVGLTIDATGFHGALVALSGTGGLAGIHATGTFQGGSTGVNSLDYSLG